MGTVGFEGWEPWGWRTGTMGFEGWEPWGSGDWDVGGNADYYIFYT